MHDVSTSGTLHPTVLDLEREGFGKNGIGRTACLREKEEATLQEPGPDPVPEGSKPGQQAVLQARRQDVAVVPRESAPALCRGAAKNFILHF